MKKLSIILLVLISFFFQSCEHLREIQITEFSVDKEEYTVGEEIKLNFQYLAVDKDVSEIAIQIDVVKKDETETNQWKYLEYNPFTDSFPNFIKDNSKYIVEGSTDCWEGWGTIVFRFKGAKALSGDETLSLKVKEEGEYYISIRIYDKTSFTTTLAWNCDSEITFKVNPATEESTPAEE